MPGFRNPEDKGQDRHLNASSSVAPSAKIAAMEIFQKSLRLNTRGKGTYELTDELVSLLKDSGLADGIMTVFCRHTSCSLVIMENADPSARRDLENWMERLVPESDPHFTHIYEGADDMPSHIKMALTRTSESIPFTDGRLALGTWQGCFLWEHRSAPHNRTLQVTLIGSPRYPAGELLSPPLLTQGHRSPLLAGYA